MKFVTIADTHGKHDGLILPAGDVLIHAGDVSMRGEEAEIMDFLAWFDKQDFAHKIFIAGNHDFYFEKETDENIQAILPEGVIYLKDSCTIIEGLKIWGSPITPWFFNWAFNRHRGDPINRHWDLIPVDTDILVTHGPAFRRLDTDFKGRHIGCKDLFNRIGEVKPKVHICGHVHEAYGTVDKYGTRFINAAVVNNQYELAHAAIVFYL